jgi:6-phosphogluconolactonase
MRISHFWRYAFGISAAVAMFSGCGGSQPAGAPGAIPQPDADRVKKEYAQMRAPKGPVLFVYVANVGGNVSAYEVNDSTDGMTQLKRSPFSAGEEPYSIARSGSTLYVANYGSDNVSAFTINLTSGALTPTAGSPYVAGAGPISVAVDGLQFVYVANAGQSPDYIGTVSAYSRNLTTGALTPVKGSPFEAGTLASAAAVDLNYKGSYLYVTNEKSDNVSAFKINGTSGALRPVKGSPFAAGTNPSGLAVRPFNNNLYVTNVTSNNVSAYNIDDGALTPIKGSPFATGFAPSGVEIDYSDEFVYVANGGYGGTHPGNVSGYTITGDGGLKPLKGSPWAAGTCPSAIGGGSDTYFVLVTNYCSNNVSDYLENFKTGALTQVYHSPFSAGDNPISVATCDVQSAERDVTSFCN